MPGPRIVIFGRPGAGKATLAATYGLPVRHTDDTATQPWSAASDEVSTWFSQEGPWVIEGVAAGRGLRKWLSRNKGKPCDVLVYLTSSFRNLSVRQRAMGDGCDQTLQAIAPELRKRGVEFQR